MRERFLDPVDSLPLDPLRRARKAIGNALVPRDALRITMCCKDANISVPGCKLTTAASAASNAVGMGIRLRKSDGAIAFCMDEKCRDLLLLTK